MPQPVMTTTSSISNGRGAVSRQVDGDGRLERKSAETAQTGRKSGCGTEGWLRWLVAPASQSMCTGGGGAVFGKA
jgi:hypothetical protein